MRVLLVGSVFARNETDDQVPWMRQMCLRLKHKGVDVEYLAPSYENTASHSVEGITVHRFRYAPKRWENLTGEGGAPAKMRKNPLLKLWAIPYLWCGFWKLFSLICKKRYDVIEVHWPFPLAYMVLPAIWAGIPVVYHYHSAELKQASLGGLARLLFKISLPWASAHVANSSYTARLLKDFSPNKIATVIPYGSPVEMQPVPREGFGKKLLFVGRHIERKGITYLLEAFKKLRAQEPAYTLTIVGNGPLTDELKAQAPEGVNFAGRVDQEVLRELYLSHDIFVLPAIVDKNNDTEGLGVVLIEAIAAGMVLVASEVGGIVDVVKDGCSGLLVPPKDIDALAGAIERVASDQALAKSLAQGAQELASELFDWQNVASKQLAVFEAVLESKRA